MVGPWTRARRALGRLALAGLLACVPVLPTPPLGSHVGEKPLRVPYPPPVVRPEIVPPIPADLRSAVWIDGAWAYDGNGWVWEPGRWQELRPGASWAPSTLVHLEGGAFAWYPGRWVLRPSQP